MASASNPRSTLAPVRSRLARAARAVCRAGIRLALGSAPLLAQVQTRSMTFQVQPVGPAPTTQLVPLAAQDLAQAAAEPSGLLAGTAAQALAAFQSQQGFTPVSDLECAEALTDWVARHLRVQGTPALLAASYRSTWNPVQILQTALAADPLNYTLWAPLPSLAENAALAGLMNSVGLHARLVDVEGSTGLEYYSWQLHRWIWMDTYFNEHYTFTQASGSTLPCGARDLNRLTLNGNLGQVSVVKHGPPSAPTSSGSYLQAFPHGFRRYAPTLAMQWLNRPAPQPMGWPAQVCAPAVPAVYQALPGETVNYQNLSASPLNAWPITPNPSALDDLLDAISLQAPITWDATGLWIMVHVWLPYTTEIQVSYPSEPWTVAQTVAAPAPGPMVSVPIHVPWASGLVSFQALDTFGNCSQQLAIAVD